MKKTADKDEVKKAIEHLERLQNKSTAAIGLLMEAIEPALPILSREWDDSYMEGVSNCGHCTGCYNSTEPRRGVIFGEIAWVNNHPCYSTEAFYIHHPIRQNYDRILKWRDEKWVRSNKQTYSNKQIATAILQFVKEAIVEIKNQKDIEKSIILTIKADMAKIIETL